MSYVTARTEGAPGAPLLFTFHGTGADEHQLHTLALELVPGAHVVSPRGDVSEMGANRYFRRTAHGVYDMDDLWARARAMAEFLAREKAQLEAEQVYAFGYSNGANILAAVSLIQPEIVDRFALMHPLIPWEPDPQPGLVGREVLITAGERDLVTPPENSRALAEYYRAQKAQVEAAWHPGGHEVRREELVALQGFFQRETAGV